MRFLADHWYFTSAASGYRRWRRRKDLHPTFAGAILVSGSDVVTNFMSPLPGGWVLVKVPDQVMRSTKARQEADCHFRDGYRNPIPKGELPSVRRAEGLPRPL